MSAAVLTDDVSDNYVSKPPFAVSEFSNVVQRGARVISGEALLCANLGFGLRLVSSASGTRHTMLFDTGPEGAIFIRNCSALGIGLGEVEAIAVTHGPGVAGGARTPRARARGQSRHFVPSSPGTGCPTASRCQA